MTAVSSNGSICKTQLVNGRIVGGHSLHAAENPDKCPNGVHGYWRTVECGGLAGEDRDILECSRCGQQKNVRCDFDEEYS
jgi:hypothetical protein